MSIVSSLSKKKSLEANQTTNKQQLIWSLVDRSEVVGFEISNFAMSSCGGRKKGYPKLPVWWELTLALGCFPFDFGGVCGSQG